MQGQRGTEKSFSEPIDLVQGSVSSNNSPNQPTAWSSYTLENPNVRPSVGRHMGESSTSTNSNRQQWLASRTESSFDTPTSTGSSNVLVNENLSRPLHINLNAGRMASGSDGVPEHVDTSPYNVDNNKIENNGDWGSSSKSKALDGGSSNSLQQGEVFGRHNLHNGSSSLNVSSPPPQSPNFNQSEELNLQMGTGRGSESDMFPPIGITETGESSSRNNEARVNHDDYDRFNTPSRTEMSQSEFLYRYQTGLPTFATDTFVNRQVPSSVNNRPQMMHNPDLSRNTSSFSFYSVDTSRASPDAASISAIRRAVFEQNAETLASLTRNSNENYSYIRLNEIRSNLDTSPDNREENLESLRRNSNELAIRYNLMNVSPVNARSSSPPPWTRSSSPPPWATPHQNNPQFYPWNPSVDSISSHSEASSSEEALMSPRPNEGHAYPPITEIHENVEVGHEWITLDAVGRQRMVSEIGNVLSSMRRSNNLRDEERRRFDGIPGFRDRHRDMRLDVDNMSYEELLALEEQIGDVNTGLNEKDILSFMKQRRYPGLFDRSSPNLEPCSICQEDYVFGDDVGELNCRHAFHTDCIKQWLTQKNLCPICKMMALDI